MRIGDLTLDRVADICKACDETSMLNKNCPFYKVLLVDCACKCDRERRQGLDDEINLEEYINERSKN